MKVIKGQLPKFVSDLKGHRWIIVAPSRVSRPHDNLPSPPRPTDVTCPFEPGNEALNKELFRIGGEPGDANWQIRVIENKYPLTQYHEVVIHSPDHEKDIDEFSPEQVEMILKTYRARYNYHRAQNHGQVLIFNNHDVHAGASIGHPHSQIVVVPPEVSLEVIPREEIDNVVLETKDFLVYCPDYSEWPYELWIAPKEHVLNNFGGISDEEIADLAPLLTRSLKIIIDRFKAPGAPLRKEAGKRSDVGLDIPYNFYISHAENWYLRIIPRLIHRAGFELGSGIMVNIVDPEQAAKEYKEDFAKNQ